MESFTVKYLKRLNVEKKNYINLNRNYPALNYLGNDLIASNSNEANDFRLFVNLRVNIWKVSTGKIYKSFNIQCEVSSLLFLEKGYLCGFMENSIKIISIFKGLIGTINEHSDIVTSLCLLGKRKFASGSKDKSIKVWQI